MTEHCDKLETRSEDERENDLVQRIRNQLIHAKANTDGYGELLFSIDCESFDCLDDLTRIPITRKSELMTRQKIHPPLGGLVSMEMPDIRYIHVSPGPIYEASGKRPDPWRLGRSLHAAGFRKGDLVQNCFSYHLTPAGFMLDGGLHKMGCAVIPGGVGQTDMQVRTICDLKPAGYVGTPSFLKIILEKAQELGSDISSLTKGLVSGEALPPPLRAVFAESGINVFQAYATADAGLIAYESIVDDGLIIDEEVYVEIVRPGSGAPVRDGEVGEVVVTTLNPDYPLIRFATGDMSAFMDGQSQCGRTNKRIRGWMGRADQTAKVRGMFIHPEQIHEITARHAEIIKAKLVIEWIDRKDRITLYCETAAPSDGLDRAVRQSIRDLCKVRGDVNFLKPGEIDNDGMVIEDIRNYGE